MFYGLEPKKFGLEIKGAVFHGEDCEKVVDVLDNDIIYRIRYRWKDDELTVYDKDLDELSETEAEQIQDILENVNISSVIYQM